MAPKKQRLCGGTCESCRNPQRKQRCRGILEPSAAAVPAAVPEGIGEEEDETPLVLAQKVPPPPPSWSHASSSARAPPALPGYQSTLAKYFNAPVAGDTGDTPDDDEAGKAAAALISESGIHGLEAILKAAVPEHRPREPENAERTKPMPAAVQAQHDALAGAVEQGRVGPRTPLGQVFSRYIAASEDKARYQAMSIAQKESFRVAWAQSRLTEIQKTYTVQESEESAHITQGEYVSFGVLLMKQGGLVGPMELQLQNLQATLRWWRNAHRLAAMGGTHARWTRFNVMSGRAEVLYTSDGILEKTTKVFEKRTTFAPNAEANDEGGVKKSPLALRDVASVDSPAGIGKSAAKRRGAEVDTHVAKKSEGAGAWSAAVKLRARFLEAAAAARSTLASVENGEWSWLKGTPPHTDVERRLADVEAAVQGNQWALALVRADPAQYKKTAAALPLGQWDAGMTTWLAVSDQVRDLAEASRKLAATAAAAS